MLFLDEAIRYRKSVRNFLSKEVDERDVEAVVRAGALAPSAKNRQPWTFIRLDQDSKDKIASLMCKWASKNKDKSGSVKESAKIITNAPVAIAICSPRKKEWPQSDYISIGACLENMSLKAVDLGLGSLIVCDIWCIEKEARRILKTNKEMTALFLMGYAGDSNAVRKKKDIKEMVKGVKLGTARKEAMDNLPEAVIGDGKFIFISYSHGNKDVVLNDIVELKRHGIKLWYDKSIMYGKKWDKEALGVIARPNCAALFLYVSRHSVVSTSVIKEVREAKKCNVPVIAIHIGSEPLHKYIDDTGAKEFKALIDEKSKFIDRSSVAAVTDDIEAVVEVCKELEVVDSSGVYDSFEYEVIEDGVKIISYNGASETVHVPDRISGKPVVEIGKNAICQSSSIKKIVLPRCVRRIGAGAFSKNPVLEEVVLPEELDDMGAAVFRECIAIKRVEIPKGIKRLPEAIFRGCVSLEESYIPDGVEELEEAVYNGCVSLKKVYVPDSVKKMTEGGFFGCVNLCELHIPADIAGLNIDSFKTCKRLIVEAGGFRFVYGEGEIVNKDG